MTLELEQIYQEYLNMDEATRVGRGKIAASKILYYLINEAGLTKREAVVILICIIKLFVSYDKMVTEEECNLFNEVTGTEFSLEKFKGIVDDKVDAEDTAALDGIIDAFPTLLKGEVCVLGLLFLASDGKISEEEREIFERVMN